MSNDAQLLLVNSTSAGASATLILGGDDATSSVASGFTDTQFGTPASSVDITVSATGASPSTAFGSVHAAWTQYGSQTGWETTHFGTATAPHWAQTIGSGTHFGTPLAGLQATGFISGAFGDPRVVTRAAATTVGLNTHYGTPVTNIIAVGWLTTHIPAPQIPIYSYSWVTGNFGEPLGFVSQVPTGIAPTTAFGSAQLVPRPVGFTSTHLGNPSTPLPVTGFVTGAFGSASSAQKFLQFSDPPSTAFGAVTTTLNLTAEATGEEVGGVGTPIALWDVTFATHWYTTAKGWRETALGTPVSPYAQALDATGFSDTAFGTPLPANVAYGEPTTTFGTPARVTYLTASGAAFENVGTPTLVNRRAATGFTGTQFGSPVAPYTHPATGFTSTALGSPTAYQTRVASSVYRATRWGTPRATKTRDHRTYGFRRTWIGNPRGWSQVNHTTTGWRGSALGAPQGDDIALYVRTLAPRARFGSALMTRNPKC